MTRYLIPVCILLIPVAAGMAAITYIRRLELS